MAQFNERVWVCDTITGAKKALLPASACSYARVMNDGAGGTMSLPINSPIAKKLDLRGLLQETKGTLVLEADNRVVAAGIIGNTSYDRDGGMLTVNHNDLWSLLAARKAIKHGPANAMTAHLNYGPLSLGTIAKRLMQEAVSPGSNYALPWVLPADVAGSESRTYYGYAMQDVASALHELMDTDGGPDIDLLPQWDSSGRLQWAPRIGNLTTNVSWGFNLDARDHGLTGVGMDTDATAISTNSYLLGEGSEKNTLYRSDPSPDNSYPALERDTAYKGVTNYFTLGSLAMERTRAYASPTQQWGASITKDGRGITGSPRVQDLRLGDTIRMHNSNDPWLPKGWSVNRLIKFSGSLESNFVKLEFQQIGA